MTKIKQITTWLSILVFMLFSLRIIWVALVMGRKMTFVLIIAALLSVVSYGLLKRFVWAFRTTALIFLVIAIFLPFGAFDPFAADDYIAAGKQPPEIIDRLLWLVPIEVVLLAAVHILDPRQKKKLPD